MRPDQCLLALIPIAYPVGSIPFGLIIGLAKGVDPRQAGSKNIGATNVGRLLGGRFFAIVFTLDLLKGLLPVIAAGACVGSSPRDTGTYLLWLGVGFASILGHMFSAFLKFTGGKGVATSTGVILGLFPYYTYPGLVAVAVWIAVFLPFRYVSLASMIGAITFPVAYVIIGRTQQWDVFGQQLPLLIFSAIVALMIVYKHRANITRLRAGTENRIGKKKPAL
jgi:acyl phosphate:glycerol-3-phosphate acyltransferase